MIYKDKNIQLKKYCLFIYYKQMKIKKFQLAIYNVNQIMNKK